MKLTTKSNYIAGAESRAPKDTFLLRLYSTSAEGL